MTAPNESYKTVSPEVIDLLERIREHYRTQGKTSAATNYVRHLRSFFHWAEGNGQALQNLTPTAVEDFLSTLSHPETTKHVMRTQIKTALRTAHNELGLDFAHLQYESGKPREVRVLQKAKEKEKRAEKRAGKSVAQVLSLPFIPAAVFQNEPQPIFQTEEPPMADNNPSDPSAPMPATPVSAGGGSPQIVVVPMPQQSAPKSQNNQNNNQRPMATIGGGAPQRGLTINNHTFSGAHVKIARVADGADPFVPMGTETYVTTLPASQLIPHGDVAAYMQQFVIPQLRLSPNTSQVPFVFYELNDRKQPTGRRDELVVGVPMHGSTPVVGAPANMNGPMGFGAAPAAPQFDRMTEMMMKKLDDEAEASRKRAEKLDEELRAAKDAQTQFILQQQFQREQELRSQIEERKLMEMSRAQQANIPAPTPIMMPPPEPPRPDPMIEMAKANTEANSRLLEAIIVKSMQAPPPPPAQKDAAEWLVPFMAQMNQQAQAQQQSNQQMIVQIMQTNQQFMQALLTRENPMEKFLFARLQEVEAEAKSPKEDELESFADKLQKMKMVSEMMGGGSGGGGGGGGIIETLISNADTIGAGIAKVLSGRSAAPTPQLAETPVPQPAPQLAAPPQEGAPQIDPTKTIEYLQLAAQLAEEGGHEREVVDTVVKMINTFAEQPEPFGNIGRRIITALGQVEDEDDLFSLSKHFWVAVGQKPDKPAAKAIAKALYIWFPPLSKNIFGEPRFLSGQTPETYKPPAGPAPDVEVEMAEEEGYEEEEEIEEDEVEEREVTVLAATA